MPIYQNLYQTLLPCPIVELRGYLAACGLRGRLYAYLTTTAPPARHGTTWPRGCWLWRTSAGPSSPASLSSRLLPEPLRWH